MASDIRVGDTGTVISESMENPDGTAVDLTGATSVKLVVVSPAAVRKELTGAVKSPATDGIVTYTTGSTDFDEAGTWKGQFSFSLGGGQWAAEVFRLRVGETL